MATSSNSSSNKRIRRDTSNTMQLHLSDLPEGILPKVASYLPNTSCVSFAMSLSNDAPTSQEPSIMSKTIIINASVESWHIVDFKDIQDVCGRSLSDDDIRWVLLAIDGVNKIKSLKFTNCIGITGVCLQPLTGSIMLERIDLSLVGDHENPNITPQPPISVSVVVPILNSIIEREDNVFEHVQLPKKWRVEKSDILTQFLISLDEVLTEREYDCSRPAEWLAGKSKCQVSFTGGACENVCQRYDNLDGLDYTLVYWQHIRHYDDQYEQQHYNDKYGTVAVSCYQCMKKICGVCKWNGGGIDFCPCCEKMYCQECIEMYDCQGRNCRGTVRRSCEVCDIVKPCYECGAYAYCPNCVPSNTTRCQYCNEMYCYDEECDIKCMYTCEGEGCSRANCNGEGYRNDQGLAGAMNCGTENEKRQDCVKQYEDEEGIYTFCGDCWEKNLEGIEDGDE